MNKCVLCVGNCTADSRAIAAVIEKHFSAEVAFADTLAETLEKLRSQTFHLVLVNRILDHDASEGLEVIRQIKADPVTRAVPVMLVSNFPEYQQQAVEAGAERGFGKQMLHAPETVALLEPLLA